MEDTQEEEGRPSETAVLTASRGDLSPCRGAARDLFLGWGWWGGLQAPQSLCDLLGLSFFWSPGLGSRTQQVVPDAPVRDQLGDTYVHFDPAWQFFIFQRQDTRQTWSEASQTLENGQLLWDCQ